MAGIKFSGFTTGATTANTLIAGYDSVAGTNNQYSLAQLAAGIEPSITFPDTLYTADGTTGAGRIVTTTDTISFNKTGSPYTGISLQPNYIAAYSKIVIDSYDFVTKYAANAGWSFGIGRTDGSFHFNTNATTMSDGYAMRVHANTDSPYGALILKGYGTSTVKNFTVQDSGANEVFSIQDDGLVNVANNIKIGGQAYSDGIVTLVDGATITPDWDDGNVQKVILGGNRAMVNPLNIQAGATYILVVVQDGSGSRELTWGTYYNFPGDTAPTLTTTLNKADVITLVAYSATVLMCTSVLNFTIT